MGLTEIAARAGVSVPTASKALNHYPGVSEQTRRRVLEAATALQASPRAYRTAEGDAEHTVVMLPIAMSVFQEFQKAPNRLTAHAYHAFQQQLTTQGFDLLLGPEQPNEKQAIQYVKANIGSRFAGVTLVPPVGPTLTEFLHRRRIPAVCLSGSPQDDNLAMVTADHGQGGRMITRHLIDLGHRRIGYLNSGLLSRSYTDRLQAFLAELYLSGIEPKKKWLMQPRMADAFQMRDLSVERWHRDIEKFIDRLIKQNDMPTALVCVNDDFARKAIDLLSVRGLRVPHDVSVTGWGDEIDLPLTTIHAQPELVGKNGAKWLTAMIRDRDASVGRLLSPVRLVVRNTTDKPRTLK